MLWDIAFSNPAGTILSILFVIVVIVCARQIYKTTSWTRDVKRRRNNDK